MPSSLFADTHPKLLIFDLDGTLIDSVPDLAVAVGLALQDLALPSCDELVIRTLVGNGSQVLCQRVLSHLGVDMGLADELHRRFLYHYAHHTTSSRPYDGVVDGLARLKRHGYRLALATNKPMQFVPSILQALGLTDFEMVLGGDSLPAKKPDPLPLLHICQTLGVAPSRSIMIGDSKNDVLAGKNANMATFALSYGYNHGEAIEQCCPDKVFDDFNALVDELLSDVPS